MVRFDHMSKKQVSKILILVLLVIIPLTITAASSRPQPQQAPAFSASDVIAAINNYRVQNGLPALSTNSLLNSLAQQQANYQASIDYVTHTGPDGSTPQQRATAAGYGDGEGFYFSEIIYGGYNATADDAMTWWKNSSTHNYYILQATYVEIGAGVATSGSTNYFTAELAGTYSGAPSDGSTDNGSSGSGTGTGSASEPTTPVNVVIPIQKSTPNADGSIIHIVQEGQTLWTIAAVYEVDLNTLLELNGLTSSSYVFVGDEIMIQPPGTLPSTTPTPEPGTTSDSISPAPTTSGSRVLGTAVAYGDQPKFTSTPIVIQLPTKLANSAGVETQSNSLIPKDKTIRMVLIIAFSLLFVVVIGSMFLQRPAQRKDGEDEKN